MTACRGIKPYIWRSLCQRGDKGPRIHTTLLATIYNVIRVVDNHGVRKNLEIPYAAQNTVLCSDRSIAYIRNRGSTAEVLNSIKRLATLESRRGYTGLLGYTPRLFVEMSLTPYAAS
jgi:hypothetical protein